MRDQAFTYGSNIGGTHEIEVLRDVNPDAGILAGRYEVLLTVPETWQAKAIAAILNAGEE